MKQSLDTERDESVGTSEQRTISLIICVTLCLCSVHPAGCVCMSHRTLRKKTMSASHTHHHKAPCREKKTAIIAMLNIYLPERHGTSVASKLCNIPNIIIFLQKLLDMNVAFYIDHDLNKIKILIVPKQMFTYILLSKKLFNKRTILPNVKRILWTFSCPVT